MNSENPSNKVIRLSDRRSRNNSAANGEVKSRSAANTRVIAVTSGKGGVG